MLEHCGITFSWGTEFGKGGPILAAKIGPGGPFLAADRFFRYSIIRVWYVFLYHTRMVVPYAYTVSYSIKLSVGTGGLYQMLITLKRLCPL